MDSVVPMSGRGVWNGFRKWTDARSFQHYYGVAIVFCLELRGAMRDASLGKRDSRYPLYLLGNGHTWRSKNSDKVLWSGSGGYRSVSASIALSRTKYYQILAYAIELLHLISPIIRFV